MEPICIRLDYKTPYMKILSVVIIMLGLLLIGLHTYSFINGVVSDRWLFGLFISICAIISGIFILNGYSLFQQPELLIDEEGIESRKTSIWDKSVKWNDLKTLSINKKNIHVQYRQSGAHDKIHLPFYTKSQHNQIEIKLAEAASRFDIEFKK